MDLLCQIPTKRGVRKALEVLPDGIDKTYSEAWHRVCTQSPQQAELGRRILSWIIHATRPLRVQELRYALAIEDNDEEVDPEGLLDVATLTSFCAGLVIVDERRGFFSLVHPTTQEYFDKHKDVLFPAAHENIAATCITYLHMRPFRYEGALDDCTAFYKRRHTCHLLGYAAVNWGFHAAMAGSEKAKSDSLSIIDNELVRAAAWQALQLNIVGARDYGTEWPGVNQERMEYESSKSFSVALHVAAYFGLISVVQICLERGDEVNQLDGTGRTPLHWAIIGKQNTTLKFLLEHGANTNAEIENDNRRLRRWDVRTLPLAQAAVLDNCIGIEYLLQHGAEINKISTYGTTTALSSALSNKCRSAMQILLENGADVNVDIRGLTRAARDEDLEFLKVAVDAGTSVFNIQRVLASAAAANNYNAIVFLLEHGANANGFEECDETDSLSFEEVQTPLVASAAHCWDTQNSKSSQCFRYLIAMGADVNRLCPRPESCQRGREITALHTAAYYGGFDMIRALVEQGADVNLSLGRQYTALSCALDSEGYSDTYHESFDEWGLASSLRVRATIRLLIDLGANPQLCSENEIHRIEVLLKMSSNDCKMVAALQTVLEIPKSLLTIIHDESFRSRIAKLKELIAAGANIGLCCDRDRERIGLLLSWSEEEIDAMDELRTHDLNLHAEHMRAHENGPI